jgi:hypothetical protein
VVRPSLRYTKNPRRVHKTCRRACIPPFDRYRVELWIRRLAEHGNGIAQKDNGFPHIGQVIGQRSGNCAVTDAAAAYDTAAVRYFGIYALTNASIFSEIPVQTPAQSAAKRGKG